MPASRFQPLEFYGGFLGPLSAILALIVGLTWLSLAERGGIEEFWAIAWLALLIGLLLSRNKRAYCRAALRGLSDEGGLTIIVAWLFAGVLGQLLVAGDLVSGLLWFAFAFEVGPNLFVLLAFITSMLFAVGTGSSNSTALAMAPVLYPSGVLLGSDPTIVALAILSGGVFGDNVAPISDTTIVSAFSQGAKLSEVVRSRLPLALVAASLSGVILFLAGADKEATAAVARLDVDTDPAGAAMLLGLIVVVASALRGKHLIESLAYGIVTSTIAAVLIGKLHLGELLHLPQAPGDSTGLIQDGLAATQNVIVFVLLLLPLTQVISDSGILSDFLRAVEQRMVRTTRQAELAIIAFSVAISTPICSNAAACLLVGPNLARPIGEKFHLAPARRANLMDCSVCSVFYMLPWHIGVMVWHIAIVTAAGHYDLPAPGIGAAYLNPYSWAILGVILFSAITGWNRQLD